MWKKKKRVWEGRKNKERREEKCENDRRTKVKEKMSVRMIEFSLSSLVLLSFSHSFFFYFLCSQTLFTFSLKRRVRMIEQEKR